MTDDDLNLFAGEVVGSHRVERVWRFTKNGLRFYCKECGFLDGHSPDCHWLFHPAILGLVCVEYPGQNTKYAAFVSEEVGLSETMVVPNLLLEQVSRKYQPLIDEGMELAMVRRSVLEHF